MSKSTISLQLPSSLLTKLKALAESNCLTLSAQIRLFLLAAVEKEQFDEQNKSN